MEEENIKRLVGLLSDFIRNGDYMYNPKNSHYSWYIDIFLNENKDNKRLSIGRFNEELARRLIVDQGIKELDANDNSNSLQQQRYDLFFNTWSSWDILYDALGDKGRLK